MNSVNELFRGLIEIAGLIVSLAVLAVILQSSNTSSVLTSSGTAFSNVLKTAMGSTGSGGMLSNGGANNLQLPGIG